MNFIESIASGFRNYATFSGRASRSEYWYWTLFTVLVGIVTVILDAAVFPANNLGPINLIANVVTFLPTCAVFARRMHDTDRRGWWWLLVFTIFGIALLIYWLCIKGTAGPNRFGPDTLSLEGDAVEEYGKRHGA